ncbi:MAG TPA: hypothetical protein VER96_12465 [Polyangiaceae bacterium]|nr:hypothetical protein [Polyangiaceae bacterium]
MRWPITSFGVNVDIDAVPSALKKKLSAEAATNLSQSKAPLMNDPATFVALLEANAIGGLPARNVVSANGTLEIDDSNVYAGESVGMVSIPTTTTASSRPSPSNGARTSLARLARTGSCRFAR